MKQKYLMIMFIIFILNLLFWPKKENVIIENDEVILPDQIIIKLEGEIVYPGIYTFYDEISIKEVVSFAGGFKSNADVNKINLNERVKKSKTIKIDKKDNEVEEYKNRVNLNKASYKELIEIPGLTEKIAINILVYKEKNGLFSDINELLKVKYIGDLTFEKISRYFEV